jgi:hypothetical protein
MPKTKQPFTEEQLRQFRNASNRASVESLRYAADIWRYTSLTTETITAPEKLIETAPPISARCTSERQTQPSPRNRFWIRSSAL